jgi:hypothetical protein
MTFLGAAVRVIFSVTPAKRRDDRKYHLES